MPYQGEFASYGPLRRLVENERVRQLLSRLTIQERSAVLHSPALIQTDDLSSDGPKPSWVIAVDGSHAEVKVDNGYPQAEVSHVTVAAVLLDLQKIEELDRHRPVDPKEFRKTEKASAIDAALPSCNVVFEGDVSARHSLRRALHEALEQNRESEDSESLLETFEILLDEKPDSREQRCPYDDCPTNSSFIRGSGIYSCQCPEKRELFSIDGLRIHEGMNLSGSNGAMFAEIMQVWERLWIINCVRNFERKKWLPMLKEVAFVLDGPLAVFGHPAWLSQAMKREFQRLNEVAREANEGLDLLVLGVEKSGLFVDHFNDLDRMDETGQERIKRGSVILIDDTYVKTHVIPSVSKKPYGKDTYFGRKLMYKTISGAKVVATLPMLSLDHEDMSRAEPVQYPRLGDALQLIDGLVSSRYPNALSPLVAAHAEAAIPLHLGNKVLERLAKELMSGSTR